MKLKRSRNTMKILRNILCLFLFIVYKMKKIQYDQIKHQLYTSAVRYMEFEERIYDKTSQIDTLKQIISKHNQEEKILNYDIHGSLKANGPVFVIFVDKYKPDLKFLITSLQHVMGIADSLLIFSHSYFDENVNNLIKMIDFTRVVQIFYPYSVQLHSDEFPKYEASDLAHKFKRNTATKSNSTGDTSDTHSKDRILAQGKQFWWWTVNHVFRKLSHTKDHAGTFIFLEDDVFLLQDFIYMMTQMKQISKLICRCDFVALHTTGETDFEETKVYGANIKNWDPKQHSSVLAFDAQIWKIISNHDYIFCSVNDYSWSRSLHQLSLNKDDGKQFKVISSTMPRAFKTSANSDTSRLFLEYNIINMVHKTLELQKRNRGNFYPLQLEIYLDIELYLDEFEGYSHTSMREDGHWSPSDRHLCYQISKHKRETED